MFEVRHGIPPWLVCCWCAVLLLHHQTSYVFWDGCSAVEFIFRIVMSIPQEEVKGIMQMVDGRSGPSLADEKKRVKGLFEPQKGRHDDEVWERWKWFWWVYCLGSFLGSLGNESFLQHFPPIYDICRLLSKEGTPEREQARRKAFPTPEGWLVVLFRCWLFCILAVLPFQCKPRNFCFPLGMICSFMQGEYASCTIPPRVFRKSWE